METIELTQQQIDERLAVPIKELGLTTFQQAAIKKLGAVTLADVFKMDAKAVADTKGVGEKTLDVLRSRFRDAEVQWGTAMGTPTAKPAEPEKPKPKLEPNVVDYIDLSRVALPHLKAELGLTMEQVFNVPKSLMRPAFTELLGKMLVKHYPKIPLSPTCRLIQVNGCGAYVCKPNSQELHFPRKLVLLSLIALAAKEVGLE